MAIPVGITTVTVNIVPPDGVRSGDVKIDVAPTVPLVWSATGDTLANIIASDGDLVLELPAVDQAGFATSAGSAFQGWQYLLTFSGKLGGVPFSESRLLKVFSSQTSIDVTFLDMIDQKAVDTRITAVGDATYAPDADWAETWIRDAFAPPSASDIPTLAWSNTRATALTTPVEAKPPILGTGAQVNNWDGASDTKLRYFPGVFNTANGANLDLGLYGSWKPGGQAQAAGWPLVFEFITDATNTTVEIAFYSSITAVDLMIEVNGRLLSDSVIRSSVASNDHKVTLTFPVARSRTIRVWGSHAMGLVAVRVPTGGTITKPSSTITRRIALIGDSWANGSSDSYDYPQGANNRETFAPRLLRLMGADSMILAGIGGTGFVNGIAASPQAHYASRVSEVVGMNPHAIVFYGSINDMTLLSQVQEQVTAALAACASVPEVYVIGPALADRADSNAAVKAATLAAGRTFIDLSTFAYGTGNALSRKGDGNRDVFLRSDNAHLTLAGHRALAETAYRKIRAAKFPQP